MKKIDEEFSGPICKEINGYPTRIMDVPDGFYAILFCGDAEPKGTWCPGATGEPGKVGLTKPELYPAGEYMIRITSDADMADVETYVVNTTKPSTEEELVELARKQAAEESEH